MALASGAGWGNVAQYSQVPDYLKLTAPGDCLCERDGQSMINIAGTSSAAAMTAGAAADYLSRKYFRIYYDLELNEGPEPQRSFSIWLKRLMRELRVGLFASGMHLVGLPTKLTFKNLLVSILPP